MWETFAYGCTPFSTKLRVKTSRSYFEEEMGVTYGKMQVPPKELCVSAGQLTIWGKLNCHSQIDGKGDIW